MGNRTGRVLSLFAALMLILTASLHAQAPVGNPFPRLGMWWPDTSKQPISDIARYDFVILGNWDRPKVPAVRARNMSIRLLNSTNACELGFNPASDAPVWDNADVLKIPPQWFLTQVGTTLTSAVDASTTTFHVAAMTCSDGSSTYDLFVAGDAAVVDGESVLVQSVNKAALTLKVRRGYVRPASSHPSGTRVAAHIAFWPNSWLLNLTTFCPKAQAAGSTITETWAEYNARVAAGLIADTAWDGILVDRADADESWLVGNSTARTIDQDQSNTLLTDYAGFDLAWNAGLRLFETRLRSLVGNNRIIFVNLGMANYDLLNGNNYEGFPSTEGMLYGQPWRDTVFGPRSSGSYFDWMQKARNPNLTMIETYEDDGGPAATSDGSYDNPFTHPGFAPNYRKMRYGLATALLNNGFFSYEINTNGHGSLGLMWFDEYDNAGAGRGYLGLPLSPATQSLASLATPNLVRSGGFEVGADLDNWDLWADTGYAATIARDTSSPGAGTASARIQITKSLGTDWQISVSQTGINLGVGKEYTLSFMARADRTRPVNAWVQQDHAPWENWLNLGTVDVDISWKRYELAAVSSGTDAQGQLIFGVGQTTGTVWLDGVQLQEGSREVWQRDYEGGRAMLNATATTQTVALGETFQKIRGQQVPSVNDGSTVTLVTIPPLDGLILLRKTPTAVEPGLWEMLY